MPYIEEKGRSRYKDILDHLPVPKTKGDLEYCIFFLQKLFMLNKEWRFADLHEATYAAQHCADEFRRRYLDKREDEARKVNGDVLSHIKPPWEED